MRPTAGEKQEFHQHSGWLIPLAFAVAVVLMCGLILGWYLRPGVRTSSAPTGESRIVHLSVHGVRLGVPANYIQTAGARDGGNQESVTLLALFPAFHGYSPSDAALFAGNMPDSPVIRMTLRGDTTGLNPRERLDRIYRPYISNPAGSRSDFGLTRYDFAGGSGYDGNELFAGNDARGLELFLCEKPAPDVPSPNCLALDRLLSHGSGHQAALSWRFKRAYLARWREVTDGVYGLIARFEKSG